VQEAAVQRDNKLSEQRSSTCKQYNNTSVQQDAVHKMITVPDVLMFACSKTSFEMEAMSYQAGFEQCTGMTEAVCNTV
jgi:hypothetical protein